MTTENGPLDLAALAERLDQAGRAPVRELHCHPGVRLWLQLTAPELEPRFPFTGSIGSLTGVPVIDDGDLERGDWELREDGLVRASGRIELPPWIYALLRPLEIEFTPVTDLPRLHYRPWLTLPSPVPLALGSII